MRTNFDTLPQRKQTNCVKWDFLGERFGCKTDADVIPLWVADMDFATPPEIMEALSKRVTQGVYGYTIISECFNKSVSNWMNKRHGATVDPSWITFSPGVVPGLINAIQAFTSEGDGVIIQPPVYYPFFMVVNDHKRKLVMNQLIETENGYVIDFADLEKKAALPNVKLMILCNPHNPVGRVFTYEELQQMGEICIKNGVKLVVDEIHADIVFKPHKHVTFTNLPAVIRNQSVVLISPSKTFNLAGFQTSAAIIPNKEMLDAYQHQAEINRTGSINCMGEVALCAAYDQCAYYVDELLEYLTANKSFAEEKIRDRFPFLKLIDLEGTYLLWVDFRKAQIPLADLDRFLIEEAKIAVDYGHWFGDKGLGFIRINIACPKHMLAEAFDRLESAMAKYTV